MTAADNDANRAPEPDARKIGGWLTPPLVREFEYLQSLGIKESEVVRRGVAMVALHERKIREVTA